MPCCNIQSCQSARMPVTSERGWSMDLPRIGWPAKSIRSTSDLRLQLRGEKKKWKMDGWTDLPLADSHFARLD
jgi:hypothetical protein